MPSFDKNVIRLLVSQSSLLRGTLERTSVSVMNLSSSFSGQKCGLLNVSILRHRCEREKKTSHAKVSPVCLGLSGLDRSRAPPTGPYNLSVSVNSVQTTADGGKRKCCRDAGCSCSRDDLPRVPWDLQTEMWHMQMRVHFHWCAHISVHVCLWGQSEVRFLSCE